MLDTAGGFGCNVDTATSAWVVLVLDIRCYVGCLTVLMQQAIPGIVLVSDEDNSTWRQFAQGCDGKGGMQLPCKMQGG